jgi:hypothetical protein
MKKLIKLFCSVLVAFAVISTADIITSYAADDVCYTTGGKKEVDCTTCNKTGKIKTSTKVNCNICSGTGRADCHLSWYTSYCEEFGEHWGIRTCSKRYWTSIHTQYRPAHLSFFLLLDGRTKRM